MILSHTLSTKPLLTLVILGMPLNIQKCWKMSAPRTLLLLTNHFGLKLKEHFHKYVGQVGDCNLLALGLIKCKGTPTKYSKTKLNVKTHVKNYVENYSILIKLF